MGSQPEPLTVKRVDYIVCPPSLVQDIQTDGLEAAIQGELQMPRTMSLLQNPAIQKLMLQRSSHGTVTQRRRFSSSSVLSPRRPIVAASPFRKKCASSDESITTQPLESHRKHRPNQDIETGPCSKDKEGKFLSPRPSEGMPTFTESSSQLINNIVPPLDLSMLNKSEEIVRPNSVRSLRPVTSCEEFKSKELLSERPTKRSLTKFMSFSQWKTLREDSSTSTAEKEHAVSSFVNSKQVNRSENLMDVTSKYINRLRDRRLKEEAEERENVSQKVSVCQSNASDSTGASQNTDDDLCSSIDKQIDEMFRPLEEMISIAKNPNEMDLDDEECDSQMELPSSNEKSNYDSISSNQREIDKIFSSVESLCDTLKNGSETSQNQELELCSRLQAIMDDQNLGTRAVTGQRDTYHICSAEMKQFAQKLLLHWHDTNWNSFRSNTNLKSPLMDSDDSKSGLNFYIGDSRRHLLSDSSSICSGSTIEPDILDVSCDTDSTIEDVFEVGTSAQVCLPTDVTSSENQKQDEGYSTPRSSIEEQVYKGHMDVFRRISREEHGRVTETEEQNLVRSTSDVCDVRHEETRRRQARERRQKLHRSDPLEMRGTKCHKEEQNTQLNTKGANESEEEEEVKVESPKMLDIPKSVCGSSKEDILHFLEKAKRKLSNVQVPLPAVQSREIEPFSNSLPDSPYLSRFSSTASLTSVASETSLTSMASGEVVDFVLKENLEEGKTFTKAQLLSMKQCTDCGKILSPGVHVSEDLTVCSRCKGKQGERRATVQELLDTEVSYGKDLTIIHDEFYTPLRTANLLSQDQLQSVFINLKELLHVNYNFISHLKEAVTHSISNDDGNLTTVPVGRIFLDTSTMFLAFENYCVHQAAAAVLLEQLEKEKELLRIFLQVSTKENSLLRRMDLKAFLMIPVQRVMKYPLFLSRLYKLTPSHYSDKDAIKRAQQKLQGVLDHINAKAKGSISQGGLRRRVSFKNLLRSPSTNSIEITKLAIESVGWLQADTRVVFSGRIQYTIPQDYTSKTRRSRSLKFSPVFGVILAKEKMRHSETAGNYRRHESTGRLNFPSSTNLQEGALVLVKERASKYTLIREPFPMESTIVGFNPECPSIIEINDLFKDPFLIKASDANETQIWLNHLRYMSLNLSIWRKRRNALPNIMIPHTKLDK